VLARSNGTRNLFISNTLYKAYVSVDQVGTEAAAATAVVMKELAAVETPLGMTADYPFICLIRDMKKGTIMFMGGDWSMFFV
jgi:serpin B